MTIKLIILFRTLTGLRKRESCSGRGQGPGWGEPQVWPIQAELIAKPSFKSQGEAWESSLTGPINKIPMQSPSEWPQKHEMSSQTHQPSLVELY